MLIMKLFKILLTLILLTTSTLSWSEIERRDGDWWLSMNISSRNSYIPGYLDGMKLGYLFSCLKYEINTKNHSDCIKLADNSFQEYNNQYFSDVTDDQLSAELDNFYSDQSNRRIFVFNAVWIVANRISGMSEADLNDMILKSRAVSAK
jgi:hypothetical protein